MNRAMDGFNSEDHLTRQLGLWIGVSIVLHGLILTWIVVLPRLFDMKSDLGPVYMVDLVGEIGKPLGPEGDPGPAEDAGPAPEPPAQPPTAEPEPVKEPEPAKLVEPEPEPPVEKTVEIPKVEPAKVLPVKPPPPKEKADAPDPELAVPLAKPKEPDKIKEPEPVANKGTPKTSSKYIIAPEAKPEDQLKSALERIKSKVGDKPDKAATPAKPKKDADASHLAQALAKAKEKANTGAYGLGRQAGAGGGGGGTGGKSSNIMALYYTRVWNKVRSNWTLPDEWRTGKLEAVVVLTVLADGRIADMRFEKKSGHAQFDQSVRRAVERSDPLPKLPASLNKASEEIGIRFRPEG